MKLLLKMNKKIILLLLICGSNILFGQNENNQLNQVKKFLPYVIKGLQETNSQPQKLDQRTVGIFEKPWETPKVKKEIAEDLLNAIITNKSFDVEKDYSGKWNFNFSSKINKNSYIKDTYNSNHLLANLFVEVSNTVLTNKNNESIIDKEKRQVRINKVTQLNFHTGVIQNNVPIKKSYPKVTGSMHLSLKEFEKIAVKEFKPNSKNEKFDLGNIKGLKLLKIENNKAFLYLPKAIENIKIISTNQKDEKYGQHAKMSMPKKVFDYATGTNVNANATKLLIDELTMEDFQEKPQILVYQTNGTIANLYVFVKSTPIELTAKKMEVNYN